MQQNSARDKAWERLAPTVNLYATGTDETERYYASITRRQFNNIWRAAREEALGEAVAAIRAEATEGSLGIREGKLDATARRKNPI